MKTMFKHKLIVAIALAAALFASYSCEDKDTYHFPEPGNEELTMLEVMQKDPDYANFLAVVDKCGVGCLDSLLNQSRVYTVWAPTNEAVDKDALIERIENGERETVFQEFVKYHISNYRHPANGDLSEESSLMMLNGKYVRFTGNTNDGYTFGDQEVIETNIIAKNGLIHKIANAVRYEPSIWELIKNTQLVKSFWDFCYSFNVKEIDYDASIKGPIVDQEQTYLDIVYRESNEILYLPQLGPVDNEDSLYIVYVPTSEVWNKVTTEAVEYFKFDQTNFTDEQKIEADSLSNVRGAKEYLRYLTYSMTDQEFANGVVDFENLPDSLVAMVNEKPRKKMAVADLTPVEIIKASNGEMRILDYMPFKPTELWFDTIRVEAENEYYNVRKDQYDAYVQRGKFNNETVDEKDIDPIYEGSELSGYAYMRAEALDGILPTRTYFVRDVLSAKYKIAIIAVPEDFKQKGDGVTNKNQSALIVNVSQSGKTMATFPDPSLVKSMSGGKEGYLPDDVIRPEKAALDTIFLTDAETGEPHIFDFEYCEKFNGFSTKTFEDKDYTVEITISSAVLVKKQGNRYQQNTAVDNTFRIDAILLIPVEEEEETGSSETEQ